MPGDRWPAKDEQAVIDRFFVDATDFFIARKWRHAYRHRTIVTADTHHHALGLYVALPQLAAQASGDERYLKELPQFEDAIRAALANERLESGFNGISLIVEGFHMAMLAGSQDKRLPQLIERLWTSGAQMRRRTGPRLHCTPASRARLSGHSLGRHRPDGRDPEPSHPGEGTRPQDSQRSPRSIPDATRRRS